MRFFILTLLAFLMVGCANNTTGNPADTNLANATRSSMPTREDRENIYKTEERRVHQKLQDFISKDYPGWTIKGMGPLSAKSPVELHIVKGAEEQLIKVIIREYRESNHQPYIVVSKAPQSDSNKQPPRDDKQNKPAPDAERKNTGNSSSNN